MTGPVNIKVAEYRLDTRIEVNPNAYHGSEGDPESYVALFSDASEIPLIRDVVTVIQADDDPSADFVSTAVVTDVDYARGLIWLHVDWKNFHDTEPGGLPFFDRVGPTFPTVNYYSEAMLISA